MITVDDTKKYCRLSSLKYTDDELYTLTDQMNKIIAVMDKVLDFDENINAYTQKTIDYSSLRDDDMLISPPTDELLKNSEKTHENRFVVPKII